MCRCSIASRMLSCFFSSIAGTAEAERILQRVRQSEQQAMSGLTEEERAVLLSATRRYVTGCKDAMKGL